MDLLRLMKNVYNHDLTAEEACNLDQADREHLLEQEWTRGYNQGKADAEKAEGTE